MDRKPAGATAAVPFFIGTLLGLLGTLVLLPAVGRP